MKIAKKLFVLPFLVFAMSSCGKTPEKEVKTYTVTWKNYDGTVLEVDKKVQEGKMPKYNGATPAKDSTQSQVFIFKGWTPKIVKVQKNATYTAEFKAEVRKYEVKWLDEDMETVLHTEMVEYGQTPTHPTDITKNDGDYIYSLENWDRDPEVVVGDQTYFASFTREKCKYTCNFYDEDGVTLLQSVENVDFDVKTGIYTEEEPTKAGDEHVIYEFAGFEELPRDTENFVRTFKAKYFEATNPANFTVEEYSLSCMITGFADSKSVSNIVFPHKINGKNVASIKSGAFEYQDCIKSVYIPNSVEFLNDYAFDHCVNLTNIEFELGKGTASKLSIYNSVFRDTKHEGALIIPSRILGSGSVSNYGLAYMSSVTAFIIEENEVENPYYTTVDGVFFSDRGQCLHTYPMSKPDKSYVVPSTVTSFLVYVGIQNNYLESLEFTTKGQISLKSYPIRCEKLTSLVFDPECDLTLEWYAITAPLLRNLILPANTKVNGRTFSNLGATADNPINIFFAGTSVENWNTNPSAFNGVWYDGIGTYVSIYIYSESEPVAVGDLPDHFTGSWHNVNDVPTIWQVA